jgi:hypothetical protein
MTSNDYWKLVFKKQAELESMFSGVGGTDIVYITSIEDECSRRVGGRVVETSLRLSTSRHGIAAKNIVDGTHRLSTPEEIARFHEEQTRRSRDCAAMTDRTSPRRSSFLYCDQLEGLGEA